MGRLSSRMSLTIPCRLIQPLRTPTSVTVSPPHWLLLDSYSLHVGQTWTDHAYNRELLPAPFLLGTTITEHQIAGTPTTSSFYRHHRLILERRQLFRTVNRQCRLQRYERKHLFLRRHKGQHVQAKCNCFRERHHLEYRKR